MIRNEESKKMNGAKRNSAAKELMKKDNGGNSSA